jgi:hypothetical protein
MYKKGNILHQLMSDNEIWVYWGKEGSVSYKFWQGSGDPPIADQ